MKYWSPIILLLVHFPLSGHFSFCSEIITYDSRKLNFSSELYPWPLHLIAWFCKKPQFVLVPSILFARVPMFLCCSFKTLKVQNSCTRRGRIVHLNLSATDSWRFFTKKEWVELCVTGIWSAAECGRFPAVLLIQKRGQEATLHIPVQVRSCRPGALQDGHFPPWYQTEGLTARYRCMNKCSITKRKKWGVLQLLVTTLW